MTDTPNDTPTKRCIQCGFECSLEDMPKHFGVKRARKDGHAAKCKRCMYVYNKQYREANYERLYAQSNEWRERNHEHYRACARRAYRASAESRKAVDKQWRVNHAEEIKARRKARYQKHKESIKAEGRRRYRENKNTLNARTREWRLRNPERLRAYDHQRRTQRAYNPEAWNPSYMSRALEYFNHTCAYCGSQLHDLFGEIVPHWDHYIPIKTGGTTVATNMLPACSKCNLSKNAADPIEWLTRKFGKSKAATIRRRVSEYFRTEMPDDADTAAAD